MRDKARLAPVIAVDGPAASVKGTIARALAKHFNLPHMDTGLLYRAVAANVAKLELDPAIEADAVAACDFEDALMADPSLRSDEIGSLASVVSAHPLVRAALEASEARTPAATVTPNRPRRKRPSVNA